MSNPPIDYARFKENTILVDLKQTPQHMKDDAIEQLNSDMKGMAFDIISPLNKKAEILSTKQKVQNNTEKYEEKSDDILEQVKNKWGSIISKINVIISLKAKENKSTSPIVFLINSAECLLVKYKNGCDK